jgi:cell division protein FtsQ
MGKRSRQKRKVMQMGVLGVFVLVLIIFLFLFQARTVDVYGNTRHSAEEISAGLGDNFLSRNTLYMMWKYRKGAIPDTLPFLDTLHVQIKAPGHIEVQVTEKEPVAYIEDNGNVFFDSEGIVLEISDQDSDGAVLITGVSTDEAVLYQKLPTESSAQLRTILSLVHLLSDHGLTATEIRFSDNMEITVYIQGVEAQMGQDEYLEEKVANLNKILPLLEGQKGTLHLENFTGKAENVPFSPSDETEAVQTTEEGSEAGEDDAENSDGTDTTGATDSVLAGVDGSSTDSDTSSGEESTAETSATIPMVFDSNGNLVYNVHIENGVVVDSSGAQVSGVTVNEDGNVVDAYMNVIDPDTGDLVQ